jgi:hypothetical protein
VSRGFLKSPWLRRALYAVIVAGLGIGIGLQTARRSTSASPVLFAEEQIDLTNRPIVEGETVIAEAKLLNRFDREVAIISWRPSCGCMVVDNAVATTLPVKVAAGGALSVPIKVNTRGQAGPHIYQLVAEVRADDLSPLPDARVQLRANIAAALHSDPLYFSFRCAKTAQPPPVHGRAVLLDKWEPSGLQIKEIACTAGTRFTYKLSKALSDTPAGFSSLIPRYILDFTIVPDVSKSDNDETITIRPDDARAQALTIPVWCHVVSPFMLEPDSLVVYADQQQPTFDRTIVYRVTDPEYRELRVKSAPPGCRLVVDPEENGQRLVHLWLTTHELRAGPYEIAFFVGRRGETATLPVRIISAERSK